MHVAGAIVSLVEDDGPNASVHLFSSDTAKAAEAVQSINGITGADLLVSLLLLLLQCLDACLSICHNITDCKTDHSDLWPPPLLINIERLTA